MDTKVRYAYYYNMDYGVFFIRRLDGGKLKGNIPEGLYNACLLDYTIENNEFISLSNFKKAISFSDDDTVAMIDFKLRTLSTNQKEGMFRAYKKYNDTDEPPVPNKPILNVLKKCKK
jgi:hypothetical protein